MALISSDEAGHLDPLMVSSDLSALMMRPLPSRAPLPAYWDPFLGTDHMLWTPQRGELDQARGREASTAWPPKSIFPPDSPTAWNGGQGAGTQEEEGLSLWELLAPLHGFFPQHVASFILHTPDTQCHLLLNMSLVPQI